MATDKLYITISDNRGDGSKGTPNAGDGGSGRKKNLIVDDDSAVKRYAEHELFHLAKNTATQAVNYALSNIGNFTGDYISQRRVNEMKQQVSGAMSIGMSTLAGATQFGAAGAVVGFIIGASSLVVGTVFDVISNKSENSKQNFNVEQLRERVGLNPIYDGSRGTEN